ncbi:MAG: hypothetical protein WDO73_22800 [Ignavibacteriota bacterium]
MALIKKVRGCLKQQESALEVLQQSIVQLARDARPLQYSLL